MEDRKMKVVDYLQKIKKMKKDQILIIFLVGVLLLIIAIPTGKSQNTESQENNSGILSGNESENQSVYETDQTYVTHIEQQLETVLSQMEGAGDVTVMITLASSAEQIIEKDIAEDEEVVTESDSQGGTRTSRNSTREETTIYGTQDTDMQIPYVRKKIMPKIEGVVVIAPGGDNAVVVKNITEVIQALFGIDTHKIRIVKKN